MVAVCAVGVGRAVVVCCGAGRAAVEVFGRENAGLGAEDAGAGRAAGGGAGAALGGAAVVVAAGRAEVEGRENNPPPLERPLLDLPRGMFVVN